MVGLEPMQISRVTKRLYGTARRSRTDRRRSVGCDQAPIAALAHRTRVASAHAEPPGHRAGAAAQAPSNSSRDGQPSSTHRSIRSARQRTDLESLSGATIRPDASSFQTWRWLIRSRAATSLTVSSSIVHALSLTGRPIAAYKMGRKGQPFSGLRAGCASRIAVCSGRERAKKFYGIQPKG